MSNNKTTDHQSTCAACPSCEFSSIRANLQGAAGLGCEFSASVLGISGGFGCSDCARLVVGGAYEGRSYSGACPGMSCQSGDVQGAVEINTPCVSIGFGWFGVDLKCNAHFGGTAGGGCGRVDTFTRDSNNGMECRRCSGM